MGAVRIFFGVIFVLVGLYMLATTFLPQIIGFGVTQSNPILGYFSDFIIPEVTMGQLLNGFIGFILLIIGIGLAVSGHRKQQQQITY